MDPKEEKMFLENLEEFVMDEDKIVTYKWLSKTLNLHVNTAKQLLYKYAMPDNVRRLNVHMNFLIGGVLVDGTGKIQIVREDDVDKVKERFKMVTSEHIYSVQKTNKIPDLNILFGVDNLKIESSEDRLGAITCKKAVRRHDTDIATLRVKALGSTAITTNKPSVAIKKTQPEKVASSNKANETESAEEKLANSKATEAEPAKPKTIASMFTAQNKKPASNNSKSPVTNNTAKKGKGGIASFFPKQVEKPIIDSKNDIVSIDKEQEYVSEKKMDENSAITTNVKKEVEPAKDKSETSLKTDRKEVIDKKASKSSQNKKGKKIQTPEKNEEDDKMSKSKRGKKKKLSEEDDKPAKKRKRIMVMSDSSSEDDIFGDDDNDDVETKPASPDIPPEDQQSVLKDESSDEDIIPPTPVETDKNSKSRKRVRKLVDKTFADEEGFIITKKEYVYESCSEEESEAPVVEKKDVAEQKTKEKDTKVAVDNDSKMEVEEEEEPSTKTGKKGSSKSKKQSAKKTPPAAQTQKSKQQSIMSFFSKPKN